MNYAILAIGTLGLCGSIYCIVRPHWPNPAALWLLIDAAKLSRCPHRPARWHVEWGFDGPRTRCVACDHRRRGRRAPLEIAKFV